MKALKLFRKNDEYDLGYIPDLKQVDVPFGDLVRERIFPARLPEILKAREGPAPHIARDACKNENVDYKNYRVLAEGFNGKYIADLKHCYTLTPFTDNRPCVEYNHTNRAFVVDGIVVDNDTKPMDVIKVARSIFKSRFESDADTVNAALGQIGDFVAQRDYIVGKGMPSCRSWEEFHTMDFLGKFPSEDFVFNDSLVGRIAKLHLIKRTEFEKHFSSRDMLKIPDTERYFWFDYLPYMKEGVRSTREHCIFRGKIVGDTVIMIPNFGSAITTPEIFDKSVANTQIADKITKINEGTACTMLLDDLEDNGCLSISMYKKEKVEDKAVTFGALNVPKPITPGTNRKIKCRVAPPALPLYNFTLHRNIITKNSTADHIRGVLRIAKVKMGGRKAVIVERLIDALEILYESYDRTLTERLNGRKFLILGARNENNRNRTNINAVWNGNEIIKSSTGLATQVDFPTFEEAYGSKQLDDTLLVMYLVRHLRGGSILDPSHVQTSYDGKELAKYVVMARDSYSSIPLLQSAVGGGQYGYYYGPVVHTIDILELLKE